jgi:uncharacterized membrane protein YphA (DoxX/SURF4 family)
MDSYVAKPILGWRVFGLGVIALALIGLAWGDFDPGQPVPKDFPAREALAYAVATFMLVAGIASQWRRTLPTAAGALAAYFWLVVALLMCGRSIVRHPSEYLAYSNTAGQVAIAAGALILFASTADLPPARAARLAHIGRMVFGICALLFGGAHFFYMNLTAPLVPQWLPPGQEFWGYATGIAHVAGGLGILLGIKPRLAAGLLAVTYGLFGLLVHLPLLIGDPTNYGVLAENAANLIYTGAAWVVADSMARPRGGAVSPPAA